MNQPSDKTGTNTSPESQKKPEGAPTQFDPKKLSDILYKNPTFTDSLLKFLLNPFILIGGLATAVYFFWRDRTANSTSEIEKLRDTNNTLLGELKSLKKQHKKLKARLEVLEGTGDVPSEGKLLSPGSKKVRKFYLE